MSGYSVEAILRATDKNFTSTMQAAQRSLGDIEGSVSRVAAVGQRIESVGKVMTAGLTLPLAAAGVAALRVGADFDESMTTVRARTGMAADEIDGLGRTFRQMAKSGEFGAFSARQVAAAYADVAVRGQSAEDATKLMRSSMILATATGNDLSATAYFLGNYLLKVGKDASYADRYIDLFALGVSNTGISLADMQNYMFRLTPAFEQFGASTETNVALMTRMYQAGIRGANLYSGLGTIMTDFAVRGDATTGMLRRFDVAITDVNGQARSNEDIMFDLAKAMAEYEDQVYVAGVVTEYLNQTQQAAWFEFMNLSQEIRNEVIPAFYAAGDAYDGLGVAAGNAATMQESLAAQARLLRSRLEEVGLQIASQLIPHVIRLVDTISRLVERFASLSPAAQRNIVIFGMVAASIGPVLIVIGKMVQAYAKLSAAIKAGNAAITAWKATQALAATAEKAKMAATKASTNATLLAKKAELARKYHGVKHAKTIAAIAKAEKAQGAATALNAKAQTAMAAATAKMSIGKKALLIVLALVTKAQVKLNVAMWANPIGLIIAAVVAAIAVIAALAVGIMALVRRFRQVSAETKQLREDMSELNDAIEDKNDALSASEDAFQDNMRSIRNNANANRDLASSVMSLASEESKSAGQRRVLKGQIDQLSTALGGLVLYYDEEAGALNISNEELAKRINLLEVQESMAAGVERHAQLLAEIHETSMKKAETNALLERAIDLQGEYSDEAEALRDVLYALGGTYEELHVRLEVASDYIYANATAYAELSEALEVFDEAVAKSVAEYEAAQQAKIEAQEQFNERMQAWVEAQEAAMNKLGSTYTRISNEATNAFRKMETETEHTMASINETLAHNVQATIDWGDNIATIMDRATAKGVDEGVLAHMRRLAQENPAMANVMANATEAEFIELANNLEAASQASVDKMATVYGIDTSVAEAARALAHETSDSVRNAIEEADYKAIAAGIPHSLADGIRTAAPSAEDAARAMAQDMEQAVRDVNQQNSPSQLYMNLGEGIPDSMATGISGNSSAAISAAEQLAESVVNAIESGVQQLDSISTSSFTGIANAARAGMNQMASAISSGLSRSVSAKTAGMRNMSVTVQASMTAMQNKVRTGMTQITQAITQGTTQMNNAVRSNFQIMQSTTLASMTAINSAVRINTQTMQTTTTASMTAMNNTVRTNTQAMQTSTSASMIALSNSVTTGMNGARNSVASAAASMSASVNTMQGSFRAAGANAAFGLAAGINANRGAAIGAAQSLANAVSSTMRSALAIRSPSRVMKAIGGYTADGFILGMLEKMQAVKSIASEMAEAIMPQNLYDEKLAFAGANLNITDDILFDTNHTVNVPVYLDARQVAKVTAKYNLHEQNLIEDRSNKRRR